MLKFELPVATDIELDDEKSIANGRQSMARYKTSDRSFPESVHRGLCVNCKYRATCPYPRNSRAPVLFCEEYSLAEVDLREAAPGNGVAIGDRFQPKPHDQTLRGLCGNCGNLETCRLPKPSQGVWHCEEYI